MKFAIELSGFVDEKIKFSGEVSKADMIKLNFDPIDRALLNDAEESAADYLLKLEMLFRRYQEQVGK